MNRIRRGVPFVQALAVCAALCLLMPTSAAAQTETVEYYASDAIGSIRVVFNASGSVTGRMDYAPFGQELYSGLLMPNERFADLTRDGESGADYAQARMYQSRSSRFTATDRIFVGVVRPQSWNRYSYALNNPSHILTQVVFAPFGGRRGKSGTLPAVLIRTYRQSSRITVVLSVVLSSLSLSESFAGPTQLAGKGRRVGPEAPARVKAELPTTAILCTRPSAASTRSRNYASARLILMT